MTVENFRYIVLQNGIGACVFNMILNGGIGWVLVRDRLPRNDLARALVFSLTSVIAFGLPALAWLHLSGVASLAATDFITFKGCLAGVQAAVFTPFTVMLALEPSPATS